MLYDGLFVCLPNKLQQVNTISVCLLFRGLRVIVVLSAHTDDVNKGLRIVTLVGDDESD